MRFASLIAFLMACSSSTSTLPANTTPLAARAAPAPDALCCCQFEEGDGLDVESQLQLDTRETCLERDGATCIAVDQCDSGQAVELDESKMGHKSDAVPGRDYQP